MQREDKNRLIDRKWQYHKRQLMLNRANEMMF
jgi:hypothetical protein